MTNIVLPAVSVLANIDDKTKLIVEQDGNINRFPIADLDIGGGDVTIDLDSSTNSIASPVNADTLNGYKFDYFASKHSLNDYATTEQIEKITIEFTNKIKINYSLVNEIPQNPIENTIWINTGNVITGHSFSDVEPFSSEEGFIWFQTGNTISDSAFNILKIDGIEMVPIRPLCVKQLINSEWKIVPAMIYHHGQWHDWWNGYLYKLGNEFEGVTGGWKIVKSANQAKLATTTTKAKDYLKLYITGSAGQGAAIVTRNKIDITDYNELHISVITGTGPRIGLCQDYLETEGIKWDGFSTYRACDSNNVIEVLDISQYSGEYYIAMTDYLGSEGTEQLYINEIWLT